MLRSRPFQYLALFLLVAASIAVIFLPIGPKPESQPYNVMIQAPQPFSVLAGKDKQPAEVADEAFVKAFKSEKLPGALTVGADGQTATVADQATTFAQAKERANQIVAALQPKFKGVELAPEFSKELDKMPDEPILPLGQFAVYPAREKDGMPIPAVKLGLDLQGGVNLVLQVRRALFSYQVEGQIGEKPADQDAFLTKVRAALAQTDGSLGLRAADVAFNNDALEIRTQAKDKAQFEAQGKAIDAALATVKDAKFSPARKPQFYQPEAETGNQLGFGDSYSSQLLDQTVEIIRSRVDKLGVSEPLIQKQLPDRIIVQLPGVNDPQKAVSVIGQTAQMRIVLLPQDLQPIPDPKDSNNTLFIDKSGNPVPGAEVLERSEIEGTQMMKRLGVLDDKAEPQPVVSGDDFKPTTTAGFTGAASTTAAVFFELKGEGSRRFAAVTREVAGKGRIIPIFLDTKCISAPNVEGAITGGSGQISGGFESVEEARELAVLLNSGALPAPIDVVENRTVSATLGTDSLVKSLRAGALGILAVAIFMVIFYRLSGLLANFALVIYCILNLAFFNLVGGTLTLPGIAGFLLALAMSLDTNILVFERLKEEMAIQPTFAAALRAAFSRAWTAILDSHVTTMIAALVLFWLGTGPVKGFALTLGIGVLLSLFSAISVTRLFMWSVAGVGEKNRNLFAGKLPEPHQAAALQK